jgi:hypothetical protein
VKVSSVVTYDVRPLRLIPLASGHSALQIARTNSRTLVCHYVRAPGLQDLDFPIGAKITSGDTELLWAATFGTATTCPLEHGVDRTPMTTLRSTRVRTWQLTGLPRVRVAGVHIYFVAAESTLACGDDK